MSRLAGYRLLDIEWQFDDAKRVLNVKFLPHKEAPSSELFEAIKEVFPEVSEPSTQGEVCFVIVPLPEDEDDHCMWMTKQYAKILHMFDSHLDEYHKID